MLLFLALFLYVIVSCAISVSHTIVCMKPLCKLFAKIYLLFHICKKKYFICIKMAHMCSFMH